jgi:GT2 family glycosyltransferase
MKKTIFVIILNWNGWQDTAECVESCGKLDYPNFHILVIDNGSTDDSEAQLQERFPDLEIIQTGENLGFSGGNNVGIKYALEQGAEYIWLLNNDTIVDPRCLSLMVQTAEADDRVGMVGSKIYYHHAPGTIWYAGGEIDLGKGGLTRHIGQDEKDQGGDNRAIETDYITGCSLLARRTMIEEVGLLEEKYFLYLEDADWSLRARQQGWRLLYQPAAHLWHKEGAQSEKIYSERFIYYYLRNRFFFVRRFAPQNMCRCHILQAKTALFFIKQALNRSAGAFFRVLGLIMAAYADFFIKQRMGFKDGL